MTGSEKHFADLLRKQTGLAAAVLSFLFLCGTGGCYQRTVIRHDSSTINYGTRNDARFESDRNRREKYSSQKYRPPLKNPTPGLENPSGKPQDMRMDELRSIIAGTPTKGGGGAAMPSAPSAPPPSEARGTGASPSRSAELIRSDVPLPTR